MIEHKPPPVVVWFKVYTGLMTLLYLVCFVGGVVLVYYADEIPGLDPTEILVQGIILAVMGLPFAIVFALPLFFKPKPWVWIYNIVMIAIGMTSCCCIPACVPLLIFWLKPEVKLWFGRSP